MGKHFCITQIIRMPLRAARVSINEYDFSRDSGHHQAVCCGGANEPSSHYNHARDSSFLRDTNRSVLDRKSEDMRLLLYYFVFVLHRNLNLLLLISVVRSSVKTLRLLIYSGCKELRFLVTRRLSFSPMAVRGNFVSRRPPRTLLIIAST